MKLAKVIGSIWATRKKEELNSLKMLLVQPLHIITNENEGAPIIAVDTIGAGIGEEVIVVNGSSARCAAGDLTIPVDATVIGIVDDWEIESGQAQRK